MTNQKTAIEPLLDICCQEAQVYRDLSSRTIQWWRSATRVFMRRTGVRFVEELTHETLRRYFFDGRIKRGWLPGTYLNYFRALNVFFKWCKKRGHLAQNPLDGLDRPRPAKRIPKGISEDDARRLLDATYNLPYSYRFERFRNHALMSLLIFTGLRISEALKLGFNDVDLEENTVTVRAGKWNKDRVVPMVPELRRSLASYVRERKRLKKLCPRFFVSLRGNTAFTATGVKLLVRRLRRATQIDFSPHKLRHTFCTMMANHGVDLLTLKQLMGHSSIETTMIYVTAYGHKAKTEVLKHPLSSSSAPCRKESDPSDFLPSNLV